MRKRLTKAVFIERAVAAHGVGRYDYSQVVFINSLIKVKICCSLHGTFEQSPKQHAKGEGCPLCGVLFNADSRRMGASVFAEKARLIHGETYDYTSVKYIRSTNAVTIICKIHGPFSQRPDAHLHQKQGCPQCAKSLMKLQPHKLSNQEFIAKAEAIHGSRYDYSLIEYINSNTKLLINCPLHGAFWQRPHGHLKGVGCAECGRTKAQKTNSLGWLTLASEKQCTLYLVRLFSDNESFYKVGVTFKSIAARFRQASHMANYQYEILAQHQSDSQRVHEWEQSILQTFSHLRYRPLRRFIGETECFSSCDEILAIFPI